MTHQRRRIRAYLTGVAAAAAALLFATLVALPSAHAATPPCQYQVTNDWGSGATVNVTITNNGSTAINGWTLAFAFPGNQTITNIWSATYTQSGANVSATNVDYDANIPANGGSTTFGFNVNYTGSNPAPTSFTLNGAACGGTAPTPTSAGPTPTPSTPGPTPTTPGPTPTSPSPSPTGGPAGDLARNKPATASSSESAALAANYAVDGNSATRWGSLYSDPQWIQVDLGASYPITHVILRWEAAYAKSFQIQTSNDATTWTAIYDTTSGTGGTSDLAVAGSGRYVRMSGTVRGTQWGYSLYDFEVYSIAPSPSPTPTPGPCGQAPADPGANSKAANLLCYLKTHTYISGQTDTGDADKVQSLTGRYPAIVAFDFMEYTNGQIQTQSVIDWYNAHHGIVAFQWHWYCPHGGNYAANCDFVPDLTNPSSKLYQDIDLIAAQLKKLGDAGIPVMFRPLHESNNNYMWWTKKGSGAYQQLWRLIFQRAQLAGVHNVVWVFNGMASGQGTSLASWYPGDAYADLVTSDYFQSSSDLNTCKSIGSNKTPGIAETFSPLNPSSDAAWPYFVVWASRDWAGSGKDVQGMWKTAMANPKTISIDQLPNIAAW